MSNRVKLDSLQEDTQAVSSPWGAIMETQLKTSPQYYLTLVRITVGKMAKYNKANKDMEQKEPLHTVGKNTN